MKEKIKSLRVQIDGLASLIKAMAEQKKYIVDIAYLPHGWTLSKFMDIYRKHDTSVIDSAISSHNDEQEALEKAMKAVREIVVGSKECLNAFESLILAKAWLGKILGELGKETPYKNDGNRKTVNDIEPAADKADAIEFSAGIANMIQGKMELSHIQKVDLLREEIQKVLDDINAPESRLMKLSSLLNSLDKCKEAKNFLNEPKEINEAFDSLNFLNINMKSSFNYYNALQCSINHLTEARFWLGFELQRIKEIADKNK